jgi:RNA polymerase sigma-70 factor (sigma-E family)
MAPALRSVYRDHYRSLVRLASLLLDSVEDCEEIVQDAFVHVWRTRPQLRDDERLPAYLRSAVLNGARSRLRRIQVARRHWRSGTDPTSRPAPDPLPGEDQHVLDALRALSTRQREVLVLRYYLDLPEAEIAATLGISSGSVKTHAHRGLTALALALEDQ